MIIKAVRHFRKWAICPNGLIKVDANLSCLFSKAVSKADVKPTVNFCFAIVNRGMVYSENY